MTKRRWLAAFGAIGLCACTRAQDPAARLCSELLVRKVPAARVLEVASEPGSGRAAIAFDAPPDDTRGLLECATQASDRGGLRLHAAQLDGHRMTEAELTVINADLFFADLQREGRARP